MKKRFIKLLAVLIAASVVVPVAGCQNAQKGSFDVHFLWPDGKAPDPAKGPYYVWIELQNWPAGDPSHSTVLSGAGPTLLTDTGVEMDLSGLTYGPNRVVRVDMRRADSKEADVAFFGVSDQFELKAGQNTDVKVLVQLQPAPGTDKNGEPMTGAVALYKNDVAVTLSNSVELDVRFGFDSPDVTYVSLSNDPTFSKNVVRRPLSDLSAVSTGLYKWPAPWNLNTGLPSTITDFDGNRNVFAKLVNKYGIESPVLSGSVYLQRTIPDVAPGSAGAMISTTGQCVLKQSMLNAVADGSTYSVWFSVNEKLALDPVLVAVNGETTIPISGQSTGGSAWKFTYTSTGSEPDGEYTLYLYLKDVAGNENATAPGTILTVSPAFRMKNVEPSLMVDQSKVSYLRSPWGRGSPEDFEKHIIPGGAYYELSPFDPYENTGSIPAGSFMLSSGDSPEMIRIWSKDMRDELGTTYANPDGSWPRVSLRRVNVEAIAITAVDGACHETNAVVVQNVEWVATPNNSPHKLSKTVQVRDSVAQDPLLSAQAAGGTGSGSDRVTQSSEVAWKKLNPAGPSPQASYGSCMAYDAARALTVIFGGTDVNNDFIGDTWTWDGISWRNVTPDVTLPQPPPMSFCSMVFDTVRNRVVLFGGLTALGDSAQLWEFGADGWKAWEPAPGSVGPVARSGHAMAFDTTRNVVVLFGGLDDAWESLGDTWEWDGTGWKKFEVAGPTPRSGYAMGFDSSTGKTIVFGGGDSGGNKFDDMWSWNGVSWSETPKSDPWPSSRNVLTMSYDSARKKLVAFGGSLADYTFGGLWEWNGSMWTDLGDLPFTPLSRFGAASTFDFSRGKTVFFGGYDFGVFGDTLELDGKGWDARTPGTETPGARMAANFASNTPGRGMFIFGGEANENYFGDTWLWNGSAWSPKTPLHSPSPRYDHATTALPSGDIIIYGGKKANVTYSDTWIFDQVQGDWSEFFGDHPEARELHDMVYDPFRNVVVLFGGSNAEYVFLNDVWEWDGEKWSDMTPQTGDSPSPRLGHAMAYYPALKEVVLFGGQAKTMDCTDGESKICNDLWSWNGKRWLKYGKASKWPEGRFGHRMINSETDNKIYIFGGDSGADVTRLFSDTWTWDPSGWTDITPEKSNIGSRRYHSMGFDPFRQKIVVFGGEYLGKILSVDYLNDTWRLAGDATRAPAVQFDVAMAGEGIPVAAVDQVTVRTVAGGSYAPYDEKSYGAGLYAWFTGNSTGGPGWYQVAKSPDATSKDPSQIVWTWKGLAADERLTYGRKEPTISVQARPIGAAGDKGSEAEVRLDYFEVRVRYTVE